MFTLDWVIVVRSVKQSSIAYSTIEVEYITAHEAAKQLVWLKKLCADLEVVSDMDKPLTLYYDNSTAVPNSKEPRGHKGVNSLRGSIASLERSCTE